MQFTISSALPITLYEKSAVLDTALRVGDTSLWCPYILTLKTQQWLPAAQCPDFP
jgi:hypothetical protein